MLAIEAASGMYAIAGHPDEQLASEIEGGVAADHCDLVALVAQLTQDEAV